MTKRKRIPVWYRMFIERRIKKLEAALTYIDKAEHLLPIGFVNVSLSYINKAKNSLK